jgi:hypothetical protein
LAGVIPSDSFLGEIYWMGLGIFDLAGDPLLGVGILEPGEPGILEAHMGIFEILGEAGILDVFGLACGAAGSFTGLCCL